MAPAEDAIKPRDENNEVVITKSRKVVALTKGVFIVLCVALFFTAIGGVYAILDNQERAAQRIIDCTIPSGMCYQAKIKDSQLRNAVQLLSVVEFCGNKNPESVDAMKVCINKEVSLQP